MCSYISVKERQVISVASTLTEVLLAVAEVVGGTAVKCDSSKVQ